MRALFGSQDKQISRPAMHSKTRPSGAEFAKLAAQQHKVEMDSRNPNRALLTVGPEDWPFPVPLVRTNGKWGFDASAGAVKCTYAAWARTNWTPSRSAPATCKHKKEYADRGSTPTEYARHVLSSPGKQDGLYWEGTPARWFPSSLPSRFGTPSSTARRITVYFSILTAQGTGCARRGSIAT